MKVSIRSEGLNIDDTTYAEERQARESDGDGELLLLDLDVAERDQKERSWFQREI